MIIQDSRLERQLKGISIWRNTYKAHGTLEGCTGYGKTYVGILIIQRMNANKPDYRTTVVVPSEVLYNDWVDPVKGHIKIHGLKNVEVYIINSLIKKDWLKTELLIIDEIHNTGAETFSRVFDIVEYKFILGLTATIERQDGKHELIKRYAPIFDTVTIEEATANNWVSKFKVFNFGIDIDIEADAEYQQLQKEFASNFSKFEHSFDLMLACGVADNAKVSVKFYPGTDTPFSQKATFGFDIRYKTGKEWREWIAARSGWRGENNHPFSPHLFFGYSSKARKAMRERKLFVYRHPKKIEIIKSILQYLKGQTILFGEDTTIANKLAQELGSTCRAYHSSLETVIRRVEIHKSYKTKPSEIIYKQQKFGKTKLKKEILEEFENKKIRVLSTVRALDEGFNVNGIEIAIQHSFNSSNRQGKQRVGRAIRFDSNNANKTAIIINLYIKNSQEEKWLESNQKGIAAIKVKSVEEILQHLGIAY